MYRQRVFAIIVDELVSLILQPPSLLRGPTYAFPMTLLIISTILYVLVKISYIIASQMDRALLVNQLFTVVLIEVDVLVLPAHFVLPSGDVAKLAPMTRSTAEILD